MATLDPAVLNKMIQARLRDSAKKRRETDPHLTTKLQRAMGLQPFPPRTDLASQTVGELLGDGIRVEKLIFQSRPGFVVPGLLAHPEGEAKGTLVYLSDAWPEGKGSPASQGFAVALSLQGFRVLVVEAPGRWYERVETERSVQGDAWEPELKMSGPALGLFVWDVLRGLDLLAERGFGDRYGVAGSGIGAEAAFLAASLDKRIVALVAANAAGSHEQTERIPESLSQLGGIGELGDVADWIGVRGAFPVLFMATEADKLHTFEAVQRTADKLKSLTSGPVRFARFLGEPDFTRRMREVAAGFFLEHLAGHKPMDYVPEPRPVTDGQHRPFASQTFSAEQCRVLGEAQPLDPSAVGQISEIARRQLQEPYPEVEGELIPWGSYGHIPGPTASEVVRLVDGSPEANGISLPFKELDYDGLSALGLSGPEFLAQVLHLWLPGSPEGMDSVAAKGDMFSSMVASVRTLVSKNEPKLVPTKIEAEGPVASLTARFLGKLRTELQLQVTHEAHRWEEAILQAGPAAIQPGARYRKWPLS